MHSIRIVSLVLVLSAMCAALEAPPAYTKHCVSCHGTDGSGRKTPALGKVPDLRSKQIAALSDDQLYDAIAHGSGHQAYAHSFLRLGVSEQELKDIVHYIRTLQHFRAK